jgi:hypothetical protein
MRVPVLPAHVLAALLAAAPLSVHALEPAVTQVLCSGRGGPCRVTAVHDAGTGADGTALKVVELALHDQPGQDWKEPGSPCWPYEMHLVVLRGESVVRRQLLSEICNDGYGAAGMGTDELEVGPNRYRHLQAGGSNWRWDRSRTLQLDPLRIVAESGSGSWTVAHNAHEEHWSWESYTGRVEWFVPTCGQDGSMPEPSGEAPPSFEYRPIPKVEMDAGFLGAGWKQTRLGSCSAVAGDGDGYVVHGPTEAEPGDASLRAVLVAERVLLVEVRDDRFVSGAQSWLHDDHVELWVGPEADHTRQCLERELRPVQWGVSVSDGKAFAAHGRPAALPAVERQQLAPDAVLLKIVLPEKPGRLTVLYSDSDDGRTQKRLVATSALKFGSLPTLGAARSIDPRLAICAVRDGKLDFVDTQGFQPDKAAIELGR